MCLCGDSECRYCGVTQGTITLQTCAVCEWPTDAPEGICRECYSLDDGVTMLLRELAGALKRNLRETQRDIDRANAMMPAAGAAEKE